MKKADDYISKIVIVESNLEHIAKSRKINGSLLVDLRRIIEEAQKEAWNEALELARGVVAPYQRDPKQSILKLKK